MLMRRPTYCLASREEKLEELKIENPDWDLDKIFEKVGMSKRYISDQNETAFTLAIKAAQQSLQDHEGRDAIDALIYVTQSPESRIPATSCLLQEKLNLPKKCATFDLTQGCSGFVYGLAMGYSFLETFGFNNCLIVCAETYTKYIDLNDRTNRPIFSDGASAVIIEKNGDSKLGPFAFITDGTGAPNLTLKQVKGQNETLYMDGPKVLMFTMSSVGQAVLSLLKDANLEPQDIDLFIFHQASKLVIDNLCRVLKLDESKVFRNYEQIGNTVSSTIPIAIRDAIDNRQLKPGMTTMLVGFGVGYSLAGCIFKY